MAIKTRDRTRLGSWFGAISFGPSVGIPTLIAVLVIAYLLMRFL